MCPARATLLIHVVPMVPHNPMAAAVCHHLAEKEPSPCFRSQWEGAGPANADAGTRLCSQASLGHQRHCHQPAGTDRKALLQRKQPPRSPASRRQSGPWIQVSVCAQQASTQRGQPQEMSPTWRNPGAGCLVHAQRSWGIQATAQSHNSCWRVWRESSNSWVLRKETLRANSRWSVLTVRSHSALVHTKGTVKRQKRTKEHNKHD